MCKMEVLKHKDYTGLDILTECDVLKFIVTQFFFSSVSLSVTVTLFLRQSCPVSVVRLPFGWCKQKQ